MTERSGRVRTTSKYLVNFKANYAVDLSEIPNCRITIRLKRAVTRRFEAVVMRPNSRLRVTGIFPLPLGSQSPRTSREGTDNPLRFRQ